MFADFTIQVIIPVAIFAKSYQVQFCKAAPSPLDSSKRNTLFSRADLFNRTPSQHFSGKPLITMRRLFVLKYPPPSVARHVHAAGWWTEAM